MAVQAEGSLAAADSRSRKRHDHKLRHCVCTEQFRNFFTKILTGVELLAWLLCQGGYCSRLQGAAAPHPFVAGLHGLLIDIQIQPPFIAKLWSDHTWPGFESIFSLGSRTKLCWFNHMPVKKNKWGATNNFRSKMWLYYAVFYDYLKTHTRQKKLIPDNICDCTLQIFYVKQNHFMTAAIGNITHDGNIHVQNYDKCYFFPIKCAAVYKK